MMNLMWKNVHFIALDGSSDKMGDRLEADVTEDDQEEEKNGMLIYRIW